MDAKKYKPVAPIGVCWTCGSRFPQVISRGKAKGYCSDSCKPAREKPSKACDVPGCARLARSNNSPHCEAHYYRLRRGGPLVMAVERVAHLHCAYCSAPSGGNKTCSDRCASRLARGTPRYKACVTCSKLFEPMNKGIDKVCCSSECERLKRQDGYDRRRCLSSSLRQGRSIRRLVFERDGWMCKLCGQPTDRNAKWPSRLYPTLDHIIPFSKGGKHEPSNLQCAHASCNSSKGARPMRHTQKQAELRMRIARLEAIVATLCEQVASLMADSEQPNEDMQGNVMPAHDSSQTTL